MEPLHPEDRPLPATDAFSRELAWWLAPRLNPAENPGPPGNGELDVAAVTRAARMLQSIVG